MKIKLKQARKKDLFNKEFWYNKNNHEIKIRNQFSVKKWVFKH